MNRVTIGINEFRGKRSPITLAAPDRLRHLYLLGKTGVGKSSVFQDLCLQDIRNGEGVCFMDPHGDSVEWLLARIPRERLKDVVLFDPGDALHPFGLNLLEAGDDAEKGFLASECIRIFYKLFDPQRSGIIGPQFEHWLRNAALTVMAGPGGSLLDIPRLFIDPGFERERRRFLTDATVIDFWAKQMAHTSSFHKSEMLNYFLSKFGPFLSDPLMRTIMGQRVNSFRFADLMDNHSIFLANLSKGRIGETNAHLLGLILLARLQSAVFARAGRGADARTPYYLYVDEFQNFATDTFESLLSESRKYGLGIHLAHQYLAQLTDGIREAVFGNVGTQLAFEVSAEDAKVIAPGFAPVTESDLTNLPRYHFYIRLMIEGKTSQAFSGITLPPEPAPPGVGMREKAVALNRLAHGWPLPFVEATLQQERG